MGLTSGSGPFGHRPAGCFNFAPDPPTAPFCTSTRCRIGCAASSQKRPLSTRSARSSCTRRRICPSTTCRRATCGRTCSSRARRTPVARTKGEASYRSLRVGERFEQDAVWTYPDPLEPAAFLAGHAAFYWKKLDKWLVEDEQVFGHPRDPYHRIDTYRTSRPVRVRVDGELLAESTRAVALFEAGLPARFYLPPEDVRTELLEPSETTTRCAYKGIASYRHARVGDTLHEDLAWTYEEPDDDGRPIRGLICFFNERVDLEIDGRAQEPPETQWSH